MTLYDPNKHHRRSIRLKGYDYSQAGAYFVTVGTWERESTFGEVVIGKMRLSTLGEMVWEEWFNSARIRREIELFKDEFEIMPNHIHGIVWIMERGAYHAPVHPLVGVDGIRPEVGVNGIHPDSGDPPEGAYHVPVHQEVGVNGIHPDSGIPREGAYHLPVRPEAGVDGIRLDSGIPREGAYHAPLRREGKTLGSFVAGFKAKVTARARHELKIWNVWQRNYYEHIIRNEEELHRIREYIRMNPMKWENDQLHPEAPPNRFNQD